MASHETRWERYDAAPPYVQFLYADPESGRRLRSIFESHSLSENLYREYARIFGDVVLGVENESRLSEMLRTSLEIPQSTADALAKDLSDFIDEYRPPSDTQTERQPDVHIHTGSEFKFKESLTKERYTTYVPSYATPLTETGSDTPLKADPYRERPKP